MIYFHQIVNFNMWKKWNEQHNVAGKSHVLFQMELWWWFNNLISLRAKKPQKMLFFLWEKKWHCRAAEINGETSCFLVPFQSSITKSMMVSNISPARVRRLKSQRIHLNSFSCRNSPSCFQGVMFIFHGIVLTRKTYNNIHWPKILITQEVTRDIFRFLKLMHDASCMFQRIFASMFAISRNIWFWSNNPFFPEWIT